MIHWFLFLTLRYFHVNFPCDFIPKRNCLTNLSSHDWIFYSFIFHLPILFTFIFLHDSFPCVVFFHMIRLFSRGVFHFSFIFMWFISDMIHSFSCDLFYMICFHTLFFFPHDPIMFLSDFYTIHFFFHVIFAPDSFIVTWFLTHDAFTCSFSCVIFFTWFNYFVIFFLTWFILTLLLTMLHCLSHVIFHDSFPHDSFISKYNFLRIHLHLPVILFHDSFPRDFLKYD